MMANFREHDEARIGGRGRGDRGVVKDGRRAGNRAGGWGGDGAADGARDEERDSLPVEAWPEIPVPPDVVIDCKAFGLAGHGRLVWAEGNAEAPVMLLLDNPGARETKEGIPFVCGTRQTLRAAAMEADIDPDNVYVTFLTKCRPLRVYDKEHAWQVGRRYVAEQIRSLRPRVLVVFGDVVTRAMTEDSGTSVRNLRGKPLTIHGIPTVPTYHPLAARRRPNLFPVLVEDLARAAGMLSLSIH